MMNFNLSRWAIEHKSLVVYFMLVIALAGTLEYRRLGREEDPPFTIKTMVVKTLWPGATTLETAKQVTDRIEKKLEELPNLDYLKSYTKPGESVVFVNLKDSTRAPDVPDLWYQVRKKIGDIKQTLPEGVQGPFFNDEFGDTYSLIFALTADGLASASCATMPSAYAPSCSASPTFPRSTSSAPRTKKSTWSSPPNSSPRWASMFPS
jgi:multidrug efflux pump